MYIIRLHFKKLFFLVKRKGQISTIRGNVDLTRQVTYMYKHSCLKMYIRTGCIREKLTFVIFIALNSSSQDLVDLAKTCLNKNNHKYLASKIVKF
jgi:hypothetical protein